MLRRREERVRITRRGRPDDREEENSSWGTRDGAPPRKTHGRLHRVRYTLASLSRGPPSPDSNTIPIHRIEQSADLCAKDHARQRDGPRTYFGYLPLFICLDESRSRREFSLFSRRDTGIVWFANSGIPDDPRTRELGFLGVEANPGGAMMRSLFFFIVFFLACFLYMPENDKI